MNFSKIILYVFFLVFAIPSVAQNVTSGYFVVPNDALEESVQEQLGNKIKASLSKAGVMATDSYFPMVTIVKYDEIETIEIEGMRKMYQTRGVVTIIVTFVNTNSALASEEFEVKGVGVSKKVSQSTAVKNINIPVNVIQKMMDKAKVGFEQSLNQFTASKIINAKKFKASKQYYDALDELTDIPKESRDFKQANTLIAEIEKLVDKEQKEEEKRQDKEAQRQFELQKQQLENQKQIELEQQKTQQTAINARAKVISRYYRAWQAYYSGR